MVEDQVGEGGDHPLEVRSNGKNRGDTGAPDKRKPRAICGAFRGALGRTRTCDLLIRRPNHAVLCGSLKCVWGLYKALPVLWGARLFYLVPVTLPSTLRMQILARRVPERVCALALFNPPHSAIADKPKEPPPSAGPGTTTSTRCCGPTSSSATTGTRPSCTCATSMTIGWATRIAFARRRSRRSSTPSPGPTP